MKKVTDDAYLKDVFIEIVVNETLLKYKLATEEEAKNLINVLNNHEKLPNLMNPRAKKKIVEFFNKVNLYQPEEFEEIKQFIQNNPGKFLKLFTKITTNNQEGAINFGELDSEGSDIKTPFRLIKETYEGD